VIRNRSALTDHGNEHARTDLLDIATTALETVHPRRTVPAVLDRDGTTLRVDNRAFDLDELADVYIIGAGKGSAAVVEEVLAVLGEYVTDGIVAEKRGQERLLDRVTVLGTGHPIPDERSLEAGMAAMDIAEEAGEDDLVIACITGGTSAQCVVPSDGISLTDLQETTEVLLHSGLPIDEVNTVRKHLSGIKGGQLAQHIAPATGVSLIVVDEVAGEPWGPTVGDETTVGDALDVFERHGLEREVPQAVREHLRHGDGSQGTETPTPDEIDSLDTVEIVLAEPHDACEAARDRAAEQGYDPMILSTAIEGESREVAIVFAGIADEIRTYGRPIEPPCVIVSGGETTVSVPDDAGEGGPNQEFGLSFALETAGVPDVTALALGTDGTDGPTEIAGALVDGTTVPRVREMDTDPWDCLQRHDSSAPLTLVDDAVYTGATGTNVMDLRLLSIGE
jgi:hydroxypyruvate reductase